MPERVVVVLLWGGEGLLDLAWDSVWGLAWDKLLLREDAISVVVPAEDEMGTLLV